MVRLQPSTVSVSLTVSLGLMTYQCVSVLVGLPRSRLVFEVMVTIPHLLEPIMCYTFAHDIFTGCLTHAVVGITHNKTRMKIT